MYQKAQEAAASEYLSTIPPTQLDRLFLARVVCIVHVEDLNFPSMKLNTLARLHDQNEMCSECSEEGS